MQEQERSLLLQDMTPRPSLGTGICVMSQSRGADRGSRGVQ